MTRTLPSLAGSTTDHKTVESFSNYLHKSDEGRNLAAEAMEEVGTFLAPFQGTLATGETVEGAVLEANSLQIMGLAV